MEHEFLKTLSLKKEIVWEEIKSYLENFMDFPEYCSFGEKYKIEADFHKKIVADYPARQGKYLRPALVLLTAQAMGFPENRAIKTAAAMQVSEDWILNHDDIEDDSLQRRGLPALHKIYGKELAINAGDGLHVLMWKILIDNQKILGDKKSWEIMQEFYQMLNRTVLGQTTEIHWSQENRFDLTEEDILFILESKTGYYSIAGPMRLGATLAGAEENQLNLLYEFGKYLGYSFQIKDDLLDLTSDFGGQKKQPGNDIYEGKRTIMLLHLFRTLTGPDLEKLKTIMEKKGEEKTPEDISWVIEKMKETGSLDYGQKMAEDFARKAKGIFDRKLTFLSEQPFRDQLLSGIDFIVNRKH